MAGKLTKSVRRPAVAFGIGGVDVLIAIPTKEKGKNTLVITPGADGAPGVATLAADLTESVPVQIEFDDSGDNVCSFSENVQFGANTYPVPTISFKLGGRSNVLNKVIEALIFNRHSFLVKLRTGEHFAVAVQNGLKPTQANSGGDGTAANFAGYDLILAGAETQLSPSITPESFNTVLQAVPAD